MAYINPTIAKSVEAMKNSATGRDKRMGIVRKVRDGEMQHVWPEQFSERYPKPIVANFVDVVARDLAEVIAPLPSLTCSAGAMKTQADKQRAERKNRIGEHYWRNSQLDVQMLYAADQYGTYGFLPGWVEADYEKKMPRIHLEDPMGAYFKLDRWLNVKEYAKFFEYEPAQLAAMYPELASRIMTDNKYGESDNSIIEVVRHVDDMMVSLYIPAREGLLLDQYAHKMSRCPVQIALRPGLHQEPRGQFDDVLFVQLARAVMAGLTLEAGHKAVQAPIILPTDVVEMSIGPDAILQTDKGNEAHRMTIEVPQAAFALEAQLDEELKIGARYPDARLGVAQASVITGKGVQALMGGFDTQIKGAQQVLGRFLRDLTSIAFEMDETLWPNKSETINGSISGRSYQVTYSPKTDIAGNYTCDVTYGFASGMSPQNAMVTMLQAQGAGLISNQTLQGLLPWGMNPDEEQRNMDIEKTQEALLQGLFSALQTSGQMVANGMGDKAMMFFSAADELVKGRQNGKPVNEILSQVFAQAQQQEQEQQAAAAAAQQGGSPDGGGDLGTGLPPGVAPGQAGLPPGGLPTVQQMVAGFNSSGNANLSSSVRRRLPAA